MAVVISSHDVTRRKRIAGTFVGFVVNARPVDCAENNTLNTKPHIQGLALVKQ